MSSHAAAAAQHVVKSAAALGTQSQPCNTQEGVSRPWYEQERLAQHDEPTGGASTSSSHAGAARVRERVKFAAEFSSSEPEAEQAASPLHNQQADPAANSSRPPASRTGFFSFTHKGSGDYGTGSAHGETGDTSINGSGPSASTKQFLSGAFGAFSRANSHTAQGSHHHVGFDASVSNSRAQTAGEAGSRAPSEGPSRSHSVMASGMSATLKGLLGGASSKIFGSIIGRNSGSSKSDDAGADQEELWFTSLDDFKPICHMLHRGRFMTAYFACANKTGQHFLLKKYDKHKMLPADERGVRRAIAFSELLQHPNLVRLMGTWESDDTIFVVEEYVGKGDILNDCISHPDKYTERHVAVALAKPLLQALSHLHANNIIHRSVLPENAYMGLDDVLRLGHLTLAIDQTSDRPESRTTLLDYMAPEMLSIQPHNEQELALLDVEGQGRGGTGSSHAGNIQQQQQQHQRNNWLQQPAQLEASRQASLDAAAAEEQHATYCSDTQAAGLQVQAAAARLSSSPMQHAGSSTLLGVGASAGRAAWEYQDHYTEKVDIWQLGCMVHELLCGSMPFELESKLESAGLSLWADIEDLPGSVPPDCADFLQQALTKDPRLRPSAQQLLQHPWLARCQAGEPWRDPLELEAARREAELSTIAGWLHFHWAAASAALVVAWQHWSRSARVAPACQHPQELQSGAGGAEVADEAAS